ncbi:MAG: Gfo/Idh/MocA family oxidoreductase, partial [Armatimonadetes bacterium]|nr:Gfo/Idh/MocA family oxidoreductase [Armatimonadota bacterium]
MRKTKVGIIGCGNISGVYMQAAKLFDILEVAACADILPERAQAEAKEHGIPKACTVDELLADPEIEIAVNLTIPKAHAEVGMAVLEAGKSLYNEKPLAVTREQAKTMLELAASGGLRIGCAPDTFLGGGIQTCRKLIDDGAIGEPVAATAFMMGYGLGIWHPLPEFIYKPGGGPMFDMGPYYLTALVNLLGPVHRATGSARITFPERAITSKPRCGAKIQVEVPTHIAGVMDFAGGAVGTIITSLDIWAAQLPCIEIYGSEGTLAVPDPNTFRGPVRLKRFDEKEWREVPLTHGYTGQSRSIGVADMAYALRSGRPHRASGELAYHVLDTMHAFHDASREGR